MKTLRLALVATVFLTLSSSAAFAVGVCATGSDLSFNDGETLVLGAGAEDPCNVGGFVFSNFEVFAATGFSGSAFSITVTETLSGLDFTYTNLSGGKDIQLTFQVTPGLSGIVLSSNTSSVTEAICADPFDPGCTTALGFGEVTPLNSTFISIDPAATNYIFKDIGGGSDMSQNVVPEPMTFSMVGLGLLGLGFAGRRRFKK